MKIVNSIYGWVIAVPIALILLGTASNQAVLVANRVKAVETGFGLNLYDFDARTTEWENEVPNGRAL